MHSNGSIEMQGAIGRMLAIFGSNFLAKVELIDENHWVHAQARSNVIIYAGFPCLQS